MMSINDLHARIDNMARRERFDRRMKLIAATLMIVNIAVAAIVIPIVNN